MRYVEVRELWLAAIQGREVPRVMVEELTSECLRVWEKLPHKDGGLFEMVNYLKEDVESVAEEMSDQVSELEKEVAQLESANEELRRRLDRFESCK